MPLPPDNDSVILGIMLLGRVCSFICPFVRTDLATTVSDEWLEQARGNLQGIFTSPLLT